MSIDQKQYYIAGPMTGLPQFNVPAFERMAMRLRFAGFEIISPAELDSEGVKAAALISADGKLDANGKLAGETWGDMLARDVKIIADVVRDGVVVLPGWERSRGARLEVFVATLCGKGIYRDTTYELDTQVQGAFVFPELELLPKQDVIDTIARSFA